MRIAFLVDAAAATPRTLAAVVEDARELAELGHETGVLRAADLRSALPPADLCVATSAATVAVALGSGLRAVVRYVTDRDRTAATDVPLVVVAPALAERLGGDAGVQVVPPHVEPVFQPGARRVRATGELLRIGVPASGANAIEPVILRLRTLGHGAWREVELAVVDAADAGERCRALHAIDLFVVPAASAADGFVPELLEALACGTPCVIADLPAIVASACGRRDAALCAEPDDESFAEAIAFVARHAGLRDRLQAAGLDAIASLRAIDRSDQLERAFALIAARASCRSGPSTGLDLSDLGDLADVPASLRDRADWHARERRFTEAAACIEAALRIAPESILMLTRLGELRFAAGDGNRALQALDRAIALGGSSCRLHELRGATLRRLRRTVDAVKAFDRAVLCDGAGAGTWRALAAALREVGDVVGARDARRQALRSEPTLSVAPPDPARRAGVR